MVNARHAVGRGRSFIEHKGGATFAGCHALLEKILGVPLREHLLIDFREIEFVIFGEFHRSDSDWIHYFDGCKYTQFAVREQT